MTKTFRAILLFALAIGSMGAAEPRQPTARWVVNFDDSQCLAVRNYGSNDVPLLLAFKAPPNGDVMQLSVIRKGSSVGPEQVRATIAFDGHPPIKATMVTFTPKGEKRLIYQINLPAQDFAAMRQARSVAIRSDGLSERFALSQMEPLLKTMNDCVADLREVWNINDWERPQPKLLQPAVGDLRGLIKPDDYPGVAIQEDADGSVAFALLIDETGKVADCSVSKTSGVAALDVQACVLIRQRARFRPAIGIDGKPAKSAYFQRITWRLR